MPDHLQADTLDDLLRSALSRLVEHGEKVEATRGPNLELRGVTLLLTDPRARLSRTERKGRVFSALGEFLWYMAGRDDLEFIAYYIRKYAEESPDGKTLPGAYGPRIYSARGINQLDRIIELLRTKPSTRRAVLQLYEAEDLGSTHEVPCTCLFQFFIRGKQLHLVTYMRSNDAFLGLPHDVFAFTLLQEYVSSSLSIEVGSYQHVVGSLHLYDADQRKANQYLSEGWQATREVGMPHMPKSPERWLKRLLEIEEELRQGTARPAESLGADLPPFWGDLARLLGVFRAKKDGLPEVAEALRSKLNCPRAYDVFVSQAITDARRRQSRQDERRNK